MQNKPSNFKCISVSLFSDHHCVNFIQYWAEVCVSFQDFAKIKPQVTLTNGLYVKRLVIFADMVLNLTGFHKKRIPCGLHALDFS